MTNQSRLGLLPLLNYTMPGIPQHSINEHFHILNRYVHNSKHTQTDYLVTDLYY